MVELRGVPRKGSDIVEVIDPSSGRCLGTIVPTFTGIRVVGEHVTDIRVDPKKTGADCFRRTVEIDYE